MSKPIVFGVLYHPREPNHSRKRTWGSRVYKGQRKARETNKFTPISPLSPLLHHHRQHSPPSSHQDGRRLLLRSTTGHSSAPSHRQTSHSYTHIPLPAMHSVPTHRACLLRDATLKPVSTWVTLAVQRPVRSHHGPTLRGRTTHRRDKLQVSRACGGRERSSSLLIASPLHFLWRPLLPCMAYDEDERGKDDFFISLSDTVTRL
ncbi:hypothetical protein L226DRAFT_97188 [Lentinus tigrinus ALCF2SS1-7]|uniref:uncharacterized protein n=1 Tax=Lentinus tigrinus ALCF2SS1-7 TaxID=1328758 RepID=UPI001165E994|nr:hypothetical protein L226DRAFT_97188 [Lentinus tigrinus ALCF2SS1-7]